MDSDIPLNNLNFSLVSAPPGSMLDPITGVFTWTPAEDQGPSTNQIVVSVSDDGVPSLTTTDSFAVVVQEVNVAPVPPAITGQQIVEGYELVVTNTASDPDIPTNALSYSFISAPAGATIDGSGVIHWTPGETWGGSNATLIVKVTDNGVSSLSATNSIAVAVIDTNSPPVLTVPDDLFADELTPLSAAATADDPDIPADTLTFSLVTNPAGMSIDPVTGVITWTPMETQGPSTNIVTLKVVDSGTPSLNDMKSFTVVVREVNSAPTVIVPIDQSIDELTTLTVTNSATDADMPLEAMTFSLINPPDGAMIDPTSGVFTWTPTEAQGPSTNTIVVRVADDNLYDINSPQLAATNAFKVFVKEVNNRPVLPTIDPQTIDELATLTITNTATDSDLPTNELVYTMVEAPSGAAIDVNGVVTWTPSEAQGPSTNTFTVSVTDTNAFAVTNNQLSATNTFTVVVREVNAAPTLVVTNVQFVVDELATLTVPIFATDPDNPTNTLTFSLVSPPAGMTIDSMTGVVTWTPSEAQGPSTNVVTVSVVDDGVDPKGDMANITIIVQEVNVAPILVLPGDQVVNALGTLKVIASATDADEPTNHLTFSKVSGPSELTIDAVSGVIMWNPTADQAGSTNIVTVQVSDDGAPSLSDTGSFTVTVLNSVDLKLSISLRAGKVALEFPTLLDRQYRIDVKSDLADNSWQPLVEDITGTGVAYTVEVPIAAGSSRQFYRVVMLP